MPCVIWRAQAARLSYQPQSEGQVVVAHGKISVYEVGGNYQFYADSLEALGQGDLHAEFEQLKAKLKAEGLFDQAKRPLPYFPQKIGIVTSSTGAALQDILHVLRRRYPLGQVIVAHTLVQGTQAPAQIIAALQNITHQSVDVIIMARGGGSLEDLWAFNNEAVARAMIASPVPIITGIGHEIDFTIADFVADVRAPTPSAAAEMVTPKPVEELQRQLQAQQMALTEAMTGHIKQLRREVQSQRRVLRRLSPQNLINNQRQRLDDLTSRLNRAMDNRLTQQQQRVSHLTARLGGLNPQAVLARGYAIVHKGEQVVSQAQQLDIDDELTVKFYEGEVQVIVKST
jgi:exodeoxyribonuclease VII large subunit